MPERADQSWILALQRGDEDAAQKLWQDYFLRLVGLARKKLRDLPPRVADPSGVVQSAFNSFFQATRRNSFPVLTDREDLWRLLVVITARKAAHSVRDEFRQKRGGGRVRGQSVFHGNNSELNGLDIVLDGEPTPELAAILNEEMRNRLDSLEDDVLRKVAVMKLHGHSNTEIAEELGCVERTVERKLRIIRSQWETTA